MGASNVRAGGAFVELYADSTKLLKGLRVAGKMIDKWGKGVTQAGQKVAGVGTAILGTGLAAVGAFGAMAASFAATAVELSTVKDQTGLSVKAFSELSFAAEKVGGSGQQVEAGVKGIGSALASAASGSQDSIDAFAKVGLSWRTLQTMSPDKQLAAIADGLTKIKNPAEKAAIASKLLGGIDLLPMLKNGSAGLAAMRLEAQRLVPALSDAEVAAGVELSGSIATLQSVFKSLATNIGSAVAPVITDLAKRITEGVSVVAKWISNNRELIVTAFKIAMAVAAAGAAIVAIGTAIVGVGAVASGLVAIAGGLATAFSAIVGVVGFLISPLGLVLVALTAAGAAFLYFSGVGSQAASLVMDVFGQLKEFVGGIIGGISDALAAGDITLAAKVLWAGLMVAWTSGVHALNEIWNDWAGAAVDVWIGIQTEISKVVIDIFAAIDTAIINFTSGFSTLWVGFTSSFSDSFVAASMLVIGNVEMIANALKEITGIDLGLDFTQIKKNIAGSYGKETADKLEAITKKKNSDLAGVESNRTGARGILDEDAGRAQDQRYKDRRASNAASLAKRDAAFSDLKGAQDAAAEAKRKAEEEAKKKVPGGPDGTNAAFSQALTKTAVSGTFGANASRSLGSTGPIDRVAAASEKTAKGVGQLVNYSKNGGSVFT